MNGYKRIPLSTLKAMARNEDTVTFKMIPCNLNPDSEWARGFMLSKFTVRGEIDLQRQINAFSAYNCNNETGTYPHYYIKGDK